MPTAGIASVAVRPEHRGAGLLAPLFAALLADARERGAVVSTLFPTAPGIYRRLGYEIVGELADVDVPVEPLTRIPAPAGITLRRPTPPTSTTSPRTAPFTTAGRRARTAR